MNPELDKDVSDLIARWRDQPNTTLEEIIEETMLARCSERENRAVDKDREGSMEDKKREGYF